MADNADGLEVENGEQPQAQETIDLAAYKSLESEYTRNRNSQIEAEVELVTLNPSRLDKITDSKLQNAVVKRISWLNDLQAYRAVYGDGAVKSAKADAEDTDMDLLLREVKLLKHNSEQAQLASEIAVFAKTNPNLSSEEAINKINVELQYISKDLSTHERVKRAAMIAFPWSTSDESSLAYQKLAELGVSAGGGGWTASAIESTKGSKPEQEAKNIAKIMGWSK